jgi:hypothetical protein
MADLALRQARLRPEAGARFPWAPTGTWLPASTLAGAALRHTVEAGRSAPDARALPDEAFEFRGGRPEATLRRRARTRRSDYSYPSAALQRRARVTPLSGQAKPAQRST